MACVKEIRLRFSRPRATAAVRCGLAQTARWEFVLARRRAADLLAEFVTALARLRSARATQASLATIVPQVHIQLSCVCHLIHDSL